MSSVYKQYWNTWWSSCICLICCSSCFSLSEKLVPSSMVKPSIWSISGYSAPFFTPSLLFLDLSKIRFSRSRAGISTPSYLTRVLWESRPCEDFVASLEICPVNTSLSLDVCLKVCLTLVNNGEYFLPPEPTLSKERVLLTLLVVIQNNLYK